MTIKIALLNTQDQIISDIKEILSEDKIVAYLFKNPHRITLDKPFLVEGEEYNEERTIQVSLSPWILATKEKQCAVYAHSVVTLVDPLDSVKEMYEEKVNADD